MTRKSLTQHAAATADHALPSSASAGTPTKAATVLALMRRSEGATLAELVEATNWQPHTTRAVLTGLRKRGHAIDRRKRAGVTCYYLTAAEG